jgi:hypothetical protein
MEDAMSREFSESDRDAVNRCRLYLQVECLSDVCTAEGHKTDPGLAVILKAQSSGLAKDYRANARGQYGDGSSDRTHATRRPTGYVSS